MSDRKPWLSIGLTIAGLIIVVAFFPQLRAWFAGSNDSDQAAKRSGGHDHTRPDVPAPETSAPALSHTFSNDGRVAMLAALDAYEAARSELARDSTKSLAAASTLLAGALESAKTAEASEPRVVSQLDAAIVSARALGKSKTAEEARPLFSQLSEAVMLLTAADPALMKGRHAFECPMWDGFARWIQPTSDIANPYMGQEMLTCGSEESWNTAAKAPAVDRHEHADGEISHYTCSMHPWVKKSDGDEPCPVCSMDLTPVTREEVSEGVVRIDRSRRQAFGIKTAVAERRKLIVPIAAVGRIATDERRLVDVTLKYKGWIEKLYVEESGQRVKRGQALFAVYSPELFAAQHELILAVEQSKGAVTETQKARSAALLRGARKRLRLWDLGDKQIDAIIAAGKPQQRIIVRSPRSGYVLEKDIVEGAAIDAGTRLFRIANLEKVWAEAEIYEDQLPLIRKGQAAIVRLSNVESQQLSGVISFIHPTLDAKTRTARIRIELENKTQLLKPDMFVDVTVEVDRGERLVIPEAAILYSGPRRIVFVDIGDNRLRPTLVEVGAKAGGYAEIRSGLGEGDLVVVSGNFLVAAESRLKSATGIW